MNIFQSYEGNTIILGEKKKISPINNYQINDFIQHYDGPKTTPHNIPTYLNKVNLYSPKRRPITSIENIRSIENKKYNEIVENKKEVLNNSRSEKLLQQNQKSGYNLITGEVYGNGPKPTRNHQRYIPDGLGPESQRRGMQIMRDSESRYFTPQFSGNHQTYRQNVIVSEGLKHSKQSKVLAEGCRESIQSYGIEDQFSKSQYISRKGQEGLPGLVEDTKPGKYSPRKQNKNNNPNSNEQVNYILQFIHYIF